MKRLIAGVFAAALLAASPAWADKDRGHGDDRHAEKQFKKEQKHREKEWRKHEKHAREYDDERYYAPPRQVVSEHHYHYVEPAPVYAAPVYAAPAGIHVVFPNLYIPIR